MKLNSNIPILIILTLFAASNAFLYQYLNDGFFLDKKPDTATEEVENVIFLLIQEHEKVLAERNAEILAEAERLRNMKADVTDSEELKAIEAQLRALEEESKAVLERVKNSENERIVAAQKAENNQLQMSELIEANSRLGADYQNLTEQFDEYVTTLEETIISTSPESDKSKIDVAFDYKRGLDFVADMVGNIQQNRKKLEAEFITRLQDQSTKFDIGLKNIAEELNNSSFESFFDDEDILETVDTFNELQQTVIDYKDSRDTAYKNREEQLTREMANKIREQIRVDQEKLTRALSNQESDLNSKHKSYIEDLSKTYETILDNAAEAAALDKENSLKELEDRLRSELVARETVTEVKIDLPEPDSPTYTSWIHIPGLWDSSISTLTFSGREVETIAWSRNSIEDNYSITFDGEFNENGELLINLFGNGRFKSWQNGVTISIKPLGKDRAQLVISREGIDENSKELYADSFQTENYINGYYYLLIHNGELSILLNDGEVINKFKIDVDLNGKIGFGNREGNNSGLKLSNIKIFKVR